MQQKVSNVAETCLRELFCVQKFFHNPLENIENSYEKKEKWHSVQFLGQMQYPDLTVSRIQY